MAATFCSSQGDTTTRSVTSSSGVAFTAIRAPTSEGESPGTQRSAPMDGPHRDTRPNLRPQRPAQSHDGCAHDRDGRSDRHGRRTSPHLPGGARERASRAGARLRRAARRTSGAGPAQTPGPLRRRIRASSALPRPGSVRVSQLGHSPCGPSPGGSDDCGPRPRRGVLSHDPASGQRLVVRVPEHGQQARQLHEGRWCPAQSSWWIRP
jgi:hypothetical protein